MNNMKVVLGLVMISGLMIACSSTNDTLQDPNEHTNETETNGDEEDNASDAEKLDYKEEEVAGDFLIYVDRFGEADFTLYFTRTTDELTREERLHQSFMESDPSQRDLFSATTNFEVDGTVVNLYFNEDDVLSMASTESAQFFEVLHEIGFRFGIDEFNLFNQDGERGLAFAENTWEEPIRIEQEPNRGYYVMSKEQSERGEYTYLSGAVAGEKIYADDDELLDFEQTIEAMATVEDDEGSYHSGIYEGLEIEEAMIDGNQAVVTYHTSDGVEASQQEREDFEQVLQLAALDFQVEELKLVNETDRVISLYPLISGADENESKHEEEKDATLTKEDAPGKVFAYIEEHESYHQEDVKAMVHDDEEGKFLVQAFVYSGEEDEAQMTNTIGWYLVDKETGEVEEKDL